jgi:bacterial/archaeal transporter family protein
MHAWQIAALIASCCIAGHYLLLRAAAGRIGDTLGALVLEATAALGVAAMYAVGIRGSETPASQGGIVFAMLSGLCITGASILLFYALRRGGPVASTGTIVLGGGVALSAMLAPVLFREPMTTRRFIGVALGLAALLILSTESTTTEVP